MKKILLAIFGAALLMVGCTKEIQTAVNDLNSRVSALEEQVAANKAAIAKFQGGAVIQNVAQTTTGWTITLSDDTVLTLYNGTNGTNGADGAPGKDGENGDAFFSSVEVDGDTVIIKLVDGTTFVLPLNVEFELQLLTEDVVLKAAATTPLLYRIKGETPQTKIHVVAGGEYTAKVSENSPEILITAPAVLTPNTIVVMADRGDGKVSVKTINIVGQELEVTTAFARVGYFWGDSFKENVVSNIPVTFSTDVPWLTFEGTKATDEYEVTVKIAPTPSSANRTGHVFVKDGAGNVVQDLEVVQGGCPKFFLNNQVSYDTWADAAAALATATADGKNILNDGTVQVIISQDTELARIDLPANDAIKALNILPRGIGVPTADPSKVVVSAVTVPAGIPTTIENIVIRPASKELVTGVNNCTDGTNGNGTALLMKPGAIDLTVNNVIFDNSNETWRDQEPTVVYTNGDGTNTGKATFTGCTFTPGVQRFAQVWGANTAEATEYVFDGCTFVNDISAYNIRIYNYVKLTLKNNTVDCVGDFVNVRTENNVVSPAVADGKTVDDTNVYSDRVVNVYTGSKAAVPATKGGEGIVKLGAIKYPTLTAAIAAAPTGSVIEVGEGEIDDNVKVPNGKTLTIKGAGMTKSVINGNLEISGSLTIKDLTLKTKEGLTTKDLGVKVSGDNYDWSHIYLARVENGATNVTFENVRFDATTEVADFASTMSMLWISQAKNIKVINCQFDAVAGGAYCPNQTHEADVLWSGNVFNGLGKKAWAIRVMDKTNAVITGNEFNIAGEAIELYNDFLNYKGSLIMGDGVTDDNYYGTGVTEAIYSVYGLADYIFNGVTIKPTSLSFNTPTTSGKRESKLSLVWSHMDDAAWAANVPDLGNIRNMAMNASGMYLAATGGQIYTLNLADGSVVKKDAMTLTDGLFKLDGMASLDDGTIVLSNMVNAAAATFKLFTYDGTKLDTLAKWTNDAIDGVAPRLGDMITASGTKDDIRVVTLDYEAASARTFFWTLKPGEVASKYSSMIYHKNGFGVAVKPSIGAQTLYKDNTYYVAYDGAANPDAVVTANPSTGGGELVGTVTIADLGVKQTRGASFFTADGKEFMALVEMRNYNGSNSYGGIVRVYALPTGNLLADLADATAVATYELPSTTANANACGNLDVITVDGKVYIGVGLRSTGAALFEFKL